MTIRQFFISLPTAICLSLILTAVGYAQLPDPYSIAAFNITDIEYVEMSNFMMQPRRLADDTDTLDGVDSPPPFIRPGQVVMRKKYGPDYRLYIGELDVAGFRVIPPVYTFPIPAWSRTGQIMWYRLFTEPTDNRNLDFETVFFDQERIYVQQHRTIYYSRNGVWDSIAGVAAVPFGSLRLDSDPPDADIYIYGVATGKKTPATFEDIIAGRYEIELFLPEHRFHRRSIHVPEGSAAPVSIKLMSVFDTLHVLGEGIHGILALPHPPIDSMYRINDTPIAGLQVRLPEGEHHLTWRGGGIYKDIDTAIDIPAGQAIYLNTPFERLTGTVFFELEPPDAQICVEGFPCDIGDFTAELPSGFHIARISRRGYETERRRFIISHGKKHHIRVSLNLNADRDFDGFPDSTDKCPDVWGLYDGCPTPTYGYMLRLRYSELDEYMSNEPFSFTVSVIGGISRSPTDKRFRDIISSFSGGPGGGFNNYSGITIGNMYQASYRGFMAALELGQWSSGIQYRRSDTLKINTRGENYIVRYDSLRNVDPIIYLPSTAFSAGFKYRLLNYSIGYSLGHQWEEIKINQIERISDGNLVDVRFNNNWWYHELLFEADMFMDLVVTPSIYMKMKFPFGPTQRTKWRSFQAGLQLRIRPINWRGDKTWVDHRQPFM
ncbi:MAG: PEGA domain-containing protein [Chitinispirillales bacterium]|jgi:hypothetical protein|nr:PEGA domain-containing protein [Chitinispirillales bacterium]